MEHKPVKLIVSGEDHLEKDPHSGAVINTDSSELQKAKARKLAFLRQQQENEEQKKEINNLNERINSVETKLDSILEILMKK